MLRIAVALGVLMVLAAAAGMALRSTVGPRLVAPGPQRAAGEGGVPVPTPLRADRVERRAPDAAPERQDLAEGPAIAGIVRDPDGGAVARAAVWLLHADREERLDSVTSDALGRFVLPDPSEVPPDTRFYRVAAHHSAHGLADPVIVARPLDGEVVRADPVLGRAGLSIDGVVHGPGGQPLADHPVALAWVDGPPVPAPEWRAGRDGAEVRTDVDGRFVARGIRAGTWEIDYEAPEVPLGFDGELPWQRVEVQAGTSGLRLTVPFVRIDVEIVGADGAAVAAGRVVTRASSPRDAATVALRLASGEAADALPLQRSHGMREHVSRTSFWVAPGAFLLVSATAGSLHGVTGILVPEGCATHGCRLRVGAAETSGVRLRVLGPDGARPSEVLFRAVLEDGLRVAPPGLEDLGSGWRRLPDDGLLAMPSGVVWIGLLADPFRVERTWLPRELLPARVAVCVPAAGGFVDRTVQLATGAFVEIEIDQDAPPSETARSAWREQRAPDGTPILRATASIELERGPEIALRLSWIAAGGEWVPVLGVPHRPGERVVLRVLGVVEPGRGRLAIQTWRPASVEEAAGWPLDLQPGRNTVRLRLDTDGVLQWRGR